MSPDLWRKYFRRPWREEIELCRRHGFYVYTHACGDNTAIMDDMVDLGVDIYNPLQPECMDIRAMKARYGGRIAYHGGIGTQHLPYTDPATIRREVKATVALMRQGGGYIAAPAKPLFPDVPLANAVALVEAMLEAGGYR
jgi:uroporphyrinogen decarboxylase